ncbi:hypothetical protein QTP86_006111 [Hemibagrus guttatus]|nr:hypothetical protein QTP86_006111 [Hemibagrus guttatus]
MFASRGASGKGGKFSVEDLYGFSKKPKASSGTGGSVCCKVAPRGRSLEKKNECEALASQILEAAQRLVERRRLELYLRESGLSIQDCQSERQVMLYRGLHSESSLSTYPYLLHPQPLHPLASYPH